jgi:hypothetical protein
MKQEYQDKIDKYVLGQMDDTEKSEFEQEAAQNTELQEQLQFTKDVTSATKSREEKLAKMENWEDDYVFEDERRVAAANYRPTGSGYDACPSPSIEQTFAKPRSSGKKFFYWITGIAAIFIAGFFLVNNLLVMESGNPASPLPYEYGNMRGGTNFTSIKELLESQDFEAALVQIGKQEQELADEMAVLEQDSVQDYERKEYELQLIEYKKDDLNWLKVQSLLGLGQKDKAVELLNTIRKSNSGYSLKADSLYNTLNK